MARGEGSDETPSRRHPGRPDVVTYRVRVDLEGRVRRSGVGSSSLLTFISTRSTPSSRLRSAGPTAICTGLAPARNITAGHEYYLCPFEVAEGETGIPEDEVRLDEVLYDVAAGCSTATTSVTTGSTSSSSKPSFPATNRRRGRPAPPGAAGPARGLRRRIRLRADLRGHRPGAPWP